MLVLIAEDNPLLALDLEEIVQADTGAQVLVAATVAAAAAQLERRIDFALLDIDLADGPSYPIASALRQRNVPFLFLSGSRREAVPPAFRSVLFIAKPYTRAGIRRAVDALWQVSSAHVRANGKAGSDATKASRLMMTNQDSGAFRPPPVG